MDEGWAFGVVMMMMMMMSCFAMAALHLMFLEAYRGQICHETLNNRIGQGIGNDDDSVTDCFALLSRWLNLRRSSSSWKHRGQLCTIFPDGVIYRNSRNLYKCSRTPPETTGRFILMQVGRRPTLTHRA